MHKLAAPVAELLDFIAMDGCTDAQFDALALRLFAYQYANNIPFRSFCQRRGTTPRNVQSWRDIPAVPIDAFKVMELRSASPSLEERVFMTSGTTRGGTRGRHFHPQLQVYDLSMRRHFAQRFMRGASRMPMGILFPDEDVMPNSSLAHYLALALREFGSEGSRNFMTAQGVDLAALWHTLEAAQRSGQPYALLGASYSFVHVMDAMQAQGLRFALPPGSRLLDTGGYKGQSREMAPDAFYDALSASFGVPRSDCINMYGMTELSTQFYDDGNARVPSVKSGPHWIRSRLVDPVSGCDVPAGERGILAHCDLANYNAVTTILTEDVGLPAEDGRGFLLLGRAEGVEAKGCSMAVEAFVRATAAA
ncbi:long-chain fatty acid--CoA ligase [Xenophilus arseniciresistens]|uniref:Long-chain fatty acid--CoA ligase n=1 Tax=Xenophilus arseniciresistens TaxID=1283306 RepID=A0AAE3NEH4_9BURK|nr:long-chain fatty acid--CoA ligase [Xenophilus arseniciresistens]MDA7418139.1 long-chain fatty acid--CoA ligase [Xenophilus arseniciresistens]